MYVGTDIHITAEIGRRLIYLIGKRIALPVTPLPGEGLADLVLRASCLNGYQVAGNRVLSHSSWTSRFDLEAFSDKLGTAHGESDLLDIAYLPMPSRFSFPSLNGHGAKISFFGSLLSPGILIKGRRVAPSGLKEKLYSKAMWHVRPLTFDAHSHERLLSKCPECFALLDFGHLEGVYRCHVCLKDLREHTQPIEEFSDVEAIRFLTGLIDPERKGSAAGLLHRDLINEDPGDIFTLAVTVAELSEKSDNRRSPRNPGIPTPHALMKAARAVLSWPNGIVDVIEQIENSSLPGPMPLNRDGKLLKRTHFIISPSLSNAVRDAHQTYKIKIGSYSNENRTRRFAEGRNPLEVARNTRAYQDGASRTGLSPLVFYGCFLSGLNGDPTDTANIAGNSFREWTDRVEQSVPANKHPAGKMQITSFVKAAFHGPGDPWPMIVNAIVDRRLPVVRPASLKRFVDLEVGDSAPWLDFLSDLQGFAHGDLVFRLSDAKLFLNATLSMSVANLFPLGTTFRDLERFNRTHVKPQELSDRLLLRGEISSRQKVVNALTHAAIPNFYNFKKSVWYSRCAAERLFDL